MSFKFLIAILFAPLLAGQQLQQDVWGPVRFLAGSWTGTGKGEPGTDKSERTYEFVLGGRFLQVRNKSVWDPRPQNPKGEIHEDWGMVSYDKGRKTFVLRQFHVEGFVNQYVMETPVDDKTRVFTSEAIENIPAGWRARETYKIVSDDEFIEVFELSETGKPFAVYTEHHFKRVPRSKRSQ